MRLIGVAAIGAALLLVSCGRSKSELANNTQGKTATSGAVTPPNNMALLATAPPKDQALKITHDRHEAMEGLGKAMKNLHRELESGKPDINVVRAQTATMAGAAAKIPGMFPAGTGPDVGRTRAKPEIWAKKDLFIQKSKDYLAAAQAIDAAAKAGDLNKVMALHENVDKACKACHDPFRSPEH